MTNHQTDLPSADDLKAALAQCAESFATWLLPHGKRHGPEWTVGGLDGAPGQSLSVRLTGPKAGLWRDFATDEGSDNLLELLRAVRGLDFATACREARTWLGLPSTNSPIPCPPHARQTAPAPYHLTDAEAARGTRMAEQLLADPGACEAIARRRGWQPQTVFGLASEASLGLSEAGRLVFLYDTGAKERWRESGERRMRFLFGKADSLWRSGLLLIAERVLVCEGETDAISLVDAGAEVDGNTLVVAVPGAGIIKPHWTRQLAGKHLVLCLDADEAGRNATEKHKATLAPHVASLQTLNLGALL